jgi:DNA-directed RNA polymerase specialized sigma24 family protein
MVPSVDETPWEVPDSAPNPEMRCAERERERFLRDALEDFTSPDSRTLVFHTLQDHSLQETAALTGISVSAAKSRVFHAKTALRKSKVLRKINERSWHGLHTRLDLQKGEIKEQEKNKV